MIQLEKHASLGTALRAALKEFSDETCLIEADRQRENVRYTYAQFQSKAQSLAMGLQRGHFGSGDRAAIIMTNQSKWLISAYAVFFRGGVLVPLDFKLSGEEHLQLIAHSATQTLIVEYPFWRQIGLSPGFKQGSIPRVLVVEAPAGADLLGAERWEQALVEATPEFVERQRSDIACIVYSSGTGGRPKGCVLLHENYLEQCRALLGLYSFWPGARYLSVLPTNHAIDFMVGFIGPFVCGATVVHLRTLRPEFVKEAFQRYRITYMALVPMVLKNLEKGLRERIEGLPLVRRWIFAGLKSLNKALTKKRANVELSRKLLKPIHQGFGGDLRTFFVGGAFTEASTLEFFYDLGIPVANGYGLTEAGTVVTVNDLKPFRSDTVGKPLPGTSVRVLDPDENGVGEIAVTGPTVMSHYLNDEELTRETIVDGWLYTGDQGRLDAQGHLRLLGRKKNMIVTEGGKNVYPEDIEQAFSRLTIKEFCIFAANYLWPKRTMVGEQLVMVFRSERGQVIDSEFIKEFESLNRRLPDFKRVHGHMVWQDDFPRTASMKIKRKLLAESIRENTSREETFVAISGPRV